MSKEKEPSRPASLPSETGEETNFYDVGRQREVLRRDLKDLGVQPVEVKKRLADGEDLTEYIESLGGAAALLGPEIVEEIKKLSGVASTFSIKEQGGLSKAKERLRQDRHIAEQSAWLDEPAITREIGPEYQTLEKVRADHESLLEIEMRWLRENRVNPQAAVARQGVLSSAREKMSVLERQQQELVELHPMAARARDLMSYKRGLHESGHIAEVPLVHEQLEEVANRLVDGKAMLLYGPTGTGKTSLARLAAKRFTGKEAEMVYCNPQTREANIWGKVGIRPTPGGGIETVDVYGPLARAASEGKVAVFDEFTALPREQMVFLKGVLNAKPGDTINIMGNGQVEVKPGFQMIFTANLKSEKNPERQEMPPEMAREFEQNNLKIEYTPPDQAYDIMLARLTNADGSIDLSWKDLNETLPNLCRAMAEIQLAYAGDLSAEAARLLQVANISGQAPSLKKLVLTQGTVENMLASWQTRRETGNTPSTFAEFLDQRLSIGLKFEEYSESDRLLAAKILAAKGLLRTLDEKDLKLPPEAFDFDAVRGLRGEQARSELVEQSAKVQHISLTQVTQLDPFGMRAKEAVAAAAEFLPETPVQAETAGADVESLKPSLQAFLLDTFKTRWGYNAEQMRVAEANIAPEIIAPAAIDWEQRKENVDPALSGQYTLNPETAGINFESIDPTKIEILDLASLRGKSLAEVGRYIVDTYGATHDVPGLEYWQYVLENPDKMPQVMKDDQLSGRYGNAYFNFGSLVRGSYGAWVVPCAQWGDGQWGRVARRIGVGWVGGCRVVLLKK